ncbi:MAG TPA: hypothetical protein EYP60_05705, partial [bacterium (Candidatus Stahlbacteria)]|nr:hypothetical protein [Candidatus Stahlbacteria bacterium]
MNTKTIVFGLDGASWELIKPWAEQGKLPIFKKLLEEGVHGNLVSTIPPVTIPAWPAMYTGLNPGKIGAFDFRYLDRHYKEHYHNSHTLKGERVWDMLNSHGYTVAIINIPGTYPVNKVNGEMIAGMLAPDKNFTYPESLESKLKEMEYVIEPKPGNIYKNAIACFQKRAKILKLYLNKNYDFIFIVFRLPDVLSHHPEITKDQYLKAYKKIDGFLGEITKSGDMNIFITSDHGIKFNVRQPLFFLNTWLIQNGYLSLKYDLKFNFSQRIISKIREFIVKNNIKLPPSILSLHKKVPSPIQKFNIDMIDFESTKAISFGVSMSCYAGIYINSEDRFESGIVPRDKYDATRMEIIEKLRREGLSAHRSEEIYGTKSERIPDIIVKFSALVQSCNITSNLFGPS